MAPVNVGLGVGVDTRTSRQGGGPSLGYIFTFIADDGDEYIFTFTAENGVEYIATGDV